MATGFIGGFATHAGGAIDTSATIQLYNATSTGVTSGTPLTTTTDSDGYYHFDNLTAGYYVVQEAETGYTTSSVSANTSINPATAINNGTAILVDVLDPSTQSLSVTYLYDPYTPSTAAIPNDDLIYGSANGSPYNQYITTGDNANQFVFSLAGNQGTLSTPGNQDTIFTLCTSLYQAFSSSGNYAVTASTTPEIPTGITGLNPTSAAAIGQIGYLYNHFGTTLLDSGNADGQQSDLGAGLQIALWSLLYDAQSPQTAASEVAALTNTSSNFYVNYVQTPAGVTEANNAGALAAASSFLQQSFGKTEDAYFLDVNPALGTGNLATSNGQSLISTDLLNFTNTPTSTPPPVANDVISGNVFVDGNNTITNASLPGDLALPNVTVTLTGTVNGTAITPVTTTTSSTGTYSFGSLLPGTYTVTETPPAGYTHEGQAAGTTGGTTGTNSITTTLSTSSLTSSNNNFAEIGSSISGTVYNDISGNGLTPGTNAPLAGDTVEPGITVNLYNSSNQLVATTVSSSTGTYSFANLPFGTYTDTEVPPAGAVVTDAAGASYSITTTPSAASSTNDNFANFIPPSLSPITNVVYTVNGQTVPNIGGNVTPGSTVTVSFTDSGTTPVSLVAYQAPGPSYSTSTQGQQVIVSDQTVTPTGNPSTVYTLTVTVPNSYYQVDFVGGLPITTLGSPNGSVTYGNEGRLIAHDNNGTQPYTTSTLSGTVYIDNNGNGVYGSGDTGVSGVTVTLSGTTDTGVVITPLTAVTSSTGAYSFSGLVPGVYSVSEPSPTGYTLETANVGSVGGAAGLGFTSGIPLNSNTAAVNYNFGQIAPGSISGTVYIDATGNGLAVGEAVQSGVTVQLVSGGKVIASQVTGTAGTYAFTGVAAGTYTVQEVVPSGYIQTGPSGLVYTQTETTGQAITQDNFANFATLATTAISNISYTTIGGGSTVSNTYSQLDGNVTEGEQVTVNFYVGGSTPVTATLVSYIATSNFYLPSQIVFGDDTETLSPGWHSLTVTVPNSYFQVDFVYGDAITQFNQNADIYYHGENRFIDSCQGGFENAPTPVSTTVANGDVGSPSKSGSTSYSNGVFSVTGGGSDIWGTSDQFQFVYSMLSGNGTIAAQVTGQTATDGWAKAGVMFRGSTSASDQYVDLEQTPSNGLAFQYRPVAGGPSYYIGGPTVGNPVYLEIVRTGDTFSGYYSTNGVNYTLVGSATFSMTPNALVGLAVTSHNSSLLSTATFANVSATTSDTTVLSTFASLSGSVFSDDNYSGCWNAGDTNVQGIEVQLKGTDLYGQSITETRFTNASGAFSFAGLQPGNYTLTELASTSYDITKTAIGTNFGFTDGTVTSYNSNTVSSITLGCGDTAIGYGWGANATLGAIASGDVAATSFWTGTNGQNLINSFDGGSSQTYLGSWLASTCPNLFGGLAGYTNSQVASYVKSVAGNSNLKATCQVLTTALGCFATDWNLNWTSAGSSYGFIIGNFGLGANTYNFGSTFSSYGLTGTATTYDFLKWVDSKSSGGTCGGGNSQLQSSIQSTLTTINGTGKIS